MNDGNFRIFCIQFRVKGKSPWLKPEGKLEPTRDLDNNWSFCGEHFYKGMYPRKQSNFKNQYAPSALYPDEAKEFDKIRQEMGFEWEGWYTIDYAIRAFKRLVALDNAGEYDYKDFTYGTKHQAVRHEYRIVKVQITKKVQPVDLMDVLDSVA